MSHRAHSLPLFLLAATAFFLGCSQERKDTASGNSKLRVAHNFSPVSAPLFVASAEKLWGGESIEFVGQEFPSGRLSLDALLANHADIAAVSETPLVQAALHGAKYSILGTITSTTENYRCIARADRGISRPEHLEGKIVAVPLGTAAEYYMDLFLKKHNVWRDKLKIINLNPPEIAGAFVAGTIDAAFNWEPYLTQCLSRMGSDALLFPSEKLYDVAFNIVARPEFVAENPELVKSLLRVLIKATGQMKADRERSIATSAARLKIDEGDIRKIWDSYRFDVKLDPSLIRLMEDEAEWVRHRDTNAMAALDFRNFIADQSLRTLDPQRVTLPGAP